MAEISQRAVNTCPRMTCTPKIQDRKTLPWIPSSCRVQGLLKFASILKDILTSPCLACLHPNCSQFQRIKAHTEIIGRMLTLWSYSHRVAVRWQSLWHLKMKVKFCIFLMAANIQAQSHCFANCILTNKHSPYYLILELSVGVLNRNLGSVSRIIPPFH